MPPSGRCLKKWVGHNCSQLVFLYDKLFLFADQNLQPRLSPDELVKAALSNFRYLSY